MLGSRVPPRAAMSPTRTLTLEHIAAETPAPQQSSMDRAAERSPVHLKMTYVKVILKTHGSKGADIIRKRIQRGESLTAKGMVFGTDVLKAALNAWEAAETANIRESWTSSSVNSVNSVDKDEQTMAPEQHAMRSGYAGRPIPPDHLPKQRATSEDPLLRWAKLEGCASASSGGGLADGRATMANDLLGPSVGQVDRRSAEQTSNKGSIQSKEQAQGRTIEAQAGTASKGDAARNIRELLSASDPQDASASSQGGAARNIRELLSAGDPQAAAEIRRRLIVRGNARSKRLAHGQLASGADEKASDRATIYTKIDASKSGRASNDAWPRSSRSTSGLGCSQDALDSTGSLLKGLAQTLASKAASTERLCSVDGRHLDKPCRDQVDTSAQSLDGSGQLFGCSSSGKDDTDNTVRTTPLRCGAAGAVTTIKRTHSSTTDDRRVSEDSPVAKHLKSARKHGQEPTARVAANAASASSTGRGIFAVFAEAAAAKRRASVSGVPEASKRCQQDDCFSTAADLQSHSVSPITRRSGSALRSGNAVSSSESWTLQDDCLGPATASESSTKSRRLSVESEASRTSGGSPKQGTRAKLSVKELKARLTAQGLDTSGCLEKADLEQRWQRFEVLRCRPVVLLQAECVAAGHDHAASLVDANSLARLLMSDAPAPSVTPVAVAPPGAPVAQHAIDNALGAAEDQVARIASLRKRSFRSHLAWGFTVLECGSEDQTASAVQRQYRALMKQLHPDRCGHIDGLSQAVETVREAKELCLRKLSTQETPHPPEDLQFEVLCDRPGHRRIKLQWDPPDDSENAPVRRYVVAAFDPSYGKALTVTLLEPDYSERLKRFVSVEELNSYVLAEEELEKMPSLFAQDIAELQVAAANEIGQSRWSKIRVPLTLPAGTSGYSASKGRGKRARH